MKKLLIFAPIAQREVDFYLAFCSYIKQQNLPYQVQFISFFQPGNQQLEKAGYKVWDTYAYTEKANEFKVKFEDLEKVFQIDNLQARTLHEKVTFNHKDTKNLLDKYYRYLNGINLILEEILKTYRPEEIQVFEELGGFIAPLSLHYNCLKHNLNHVFFEPSFFRSHMHFVVNDLVLNLPSVHEVTDADVAEHQKSVEDYFAAITNSQKLVIVKKDIQHYRDMGLLKLFNSYNIEKLYKKIAHKYIHNYKQEYEWIGNHILRNIKQYFNRLRSGKFYTHEIPTEKFIYFPFHVQLDYQLTIRNPEFLNQLALVKHLCEICPKEYKVVVKEHPVTIGGFDYPEMHKLLKYNANIVLLQPMINTHEIVKRAEAIVTINSKVGAESLIYNKNVVCLGHGFYWGSKVVEKLDGYQALAQWLSKFARGEIAAPDRNQILRYFSGVKKHSYPFELYNHEPANLQRFYDSLLSYIKNS